ncbi:MAG TPA: cytochrome c oxidase subunit II [Acidimicrobiales bacterium]|nr:cytochrome c oxidase subunit II [Acidimicrobiales bacterium]
MTLAKVGAVNDPTNGTVAPVRLQRRLLTVVAAIALPVVLGGCQVPRFYGYRGATRQGHDEFMLYAGTFIAAIAVGAFTGLLILWAVVRYRRRSDEMPRQFQYHIPLEITYTIVPILMVLVLFGFTVIDENKVDAVVNHPDVTVNVYAFQWGWEFDYPGAQVTIQGETSTDPDPVGPAGPSGPPCAPAIDCLGPGLVLPAGETAQINLRSRDVIHGFYVPEFNFSRYAQPGVLNQFDFTPTNAGVYRAQCTQFCGLYHSIMLFHVVAMAPAQFQAWLSAERSKNQPSPANTGGGNYPNVATTQNSPYTPVGGALSRRSTNRTKAPV